MQVVVDRAAFFDRVRDGREIVIREHHVRGLLGDLGALLAHGDADIGALQRGRIVDAVPGHGHDMAVGLNAADQAQLMLGVHASEHVRVRDDLCECGILEVVKLPAG